MIRPALVILTGFSYVKWHDIKTVAYDGFKSANKWFDELGHIKKPPQRKHLDMDKAKPALTPEATNESRLKDKELYT